MSEIESFSNTYENACRVIDAAYKIAAQYSFVHFWEQPNENTFNARLCRELGLPVTTHSIHQILVIVNTWNVHEILKGLFNGSITSIKPNRKF